MANEKNSAPLAAPKSAKDSKKEKFDRLAEKIKENQRNKDLKQFQEDLKKRIQLTKTARIALAKKDAGTAIADFKYFLYLTARSHGVEVRDLNPKLFDPAVRTSESLLIAAVCFDLLKIYDKIEGANEEFQMYLRLLILFSHGMPFQNFIADNLFRFLQYTTILMHKNDIEIAYKSIGKKKACFIATAAFDDENAPEVEALRNFRDETLVKFMAGRIFTNAYYKISPPLAKFVKRQKKKKKITRQCIRTLLNLSS